MSIQSCHECGGIVSSEARGCPHCGARSTPRHRRVRTGLAAVALVLGGTTVGYFLGPGPVGKVARTREAVADAALPMSEALSVRERTELLRQELQRFVRLHERFLQQNGRWPNYDEAPGGAGGIAIMYDVMGGNWTASARFDEQRGLLCAVSVGRPAYIEGIVLKRSGEVRCSRDLATRVNAFLRQVLPVRFTV